MFAVFIERGCANAVKLAACKRGLQQIRSIHRAIGFACTHKRMHFIDEEDNTPFSCCDFRENGFQTFFKFAAIFRACNQSTHIKRKKFFIRKAFRYIAIDDAQGQAFGNRRFADAWFANKNGIIFSTTREHLNGTADFFIAPDDRIKLSGARGFRQITGVFFERFISVFSRRIVSCTTFAQIIDRVVERLRCYTRFGEHFTGIHIFLGRNREQEPFNGDIGIARF